MYASLAETKRFSTIKDDIKREMVIVGKSNRYNESQD